MITTKKGFIAFLLSLLMLMCFTVAVGEETAEDDSQSIFVTNTPIKGQIVLEKTGMVLTGFIESQDSTGYTVYTPDYHEGHIAGAVYEVRAVEDIVGKEGTRWFAADEVAATITTTAEGSEESTTTWVPIYTSDDDDALATPYADPTVNVKSFTSIGNIYGGGLGETAVVVGNPTVNINVAEGEHATTVISDNATTEAIRTGDDTAEGGYAVPSHESGKIGAIQNVYGGGNAARVVGNTNVNIGTTTGSDVYMEAVMVKTGKTLTDDYYTRSGAGTEESPYTYTAASGTAVEGTTYYKRYTVKGADIRGNVYGGGNQAEVTGNANVTIGKKM